MGADLLTWFNELPAAAARDELRDCCPSPKWVEGMASGRPYSSPQDAIRQSSAIVAGMTVTDLAEALVGQPLTEGSSKSATGDAETSRELATSHLEYEQRFGHAYLVCASGKSSAQLLALLRRRLQNDARSEWQVVRSELQKINESRLRVLLAGSA